MGKSFLIDTNTVLDFLGNELPIQGMEMISEVVDSIPNISVINKIELLGYDMPKSEEKTIVNFVEDCIVIELTNKIVNETISIRKWKKIKLPDAVIAATAIILGYTLISRNEKDFKGIPKLKVLNPHKL